MNGAIKSRDDQRTLCAPEAARNVRMRGGRCSSYCPPESTTAGIGDSEAACTYGHNGPLRAPRPVLPRSCSDVTVESWQSPLLAAPCPLRRSRQSGKPYTTRREIPSKPIRNEDDSFTRVRWAPCEVRRGSRYDICDKFSLAPDQRLATGCVLRPLGAGSISVRQGALVGEDRHRQRRDQGTRNADAGYDQPASADCSTNQS